MTSTPTPIECPHCGRALGLIEIGEADCPYCGTYFIVAEDHAITHVVPLRTSWAANFAIVIATVAMIWVSFSEANDRTRSIVLWALTTAGLTYAAIEGFRDGILRVEKLFFSRRNHPIGFRIYVIVLACLALAAAVQFVRLLLGSAG